MKTPNDQCTDNEIDLLPLIHAFWESKLKIIAAVVIGIAMALAAFYVLPPKWVASTYITKGSLLSVYREVRSTETVPAATTQPIEIKLYNSIQDDVFYVAMGIMAAKKIDVVATRQPLIYLASFKASSKELAADHNLRAFNTLGEIKVIKSKSLVAYLAIGASLGFIVACLLIFFPLLKAYYERAVDK
ncbi:Wzz/FepE/Etk N-terminal domain-containing protein [Pseudomonas sp. Marseille-Q1929]|uniref:Wzz/FepE/Etk N-terminal domain-containing protein n=1 Tax=Pseudomonas sp. Marseille-Q1929 TaxID=2730402 RepID=UPI001A8DE89A|nr:Wzz/FepE/Etk N-terminal domain-containing protein [Pseudomonas sp. Marseille-Q1929]MBO0495803.1 hypothetical protein [Pseudomonas sp. Marseille-Q1929]